MILIEVMTINCFVIVLTAINLKEKRLLLFFFIYLQIEPPNYNPKYTYLNKKIIYSPFISSLGFTYNFIILVPSIIQSRVRRNDLSLEFGYSGSLCYLGRIAA